MVDDFTNEEAARERDGNDFTAEEPHRKRRDKVTK